MSPDNFVTPKNLCISLLYILHINNMYMNPKLYIPSENQKLRITK